MRYSVAAVPVSEAEIAGMSAETDSAWGKVSYLKPALSLSSTEVAWRRPPSPLGSDSPVFLT